jgi:hypothetical protein
VTDTLQTENTAPAAPEEIAPPGAPAISDTEKAGLQSGLELMAGQDEDLEKSGFSEEWKDQRDYIEHKPISEERRSNWFKRAQQAASRQAEIVNNEYGAKEAKQLETAAPAPRQDPTYFTGEQVQALNEHARKVGASVVRGEQYFGGNTERVKEAYEWHEALDPEGRVRQRYVDSELGPHMADVLTRDRAGLDQLEALAAMPDHDLDVNIARLEGMIRGRQSSANTWSAQPRQTSKAPPVMKSVKGGVMPPQDIHHLASKSEDISDYVKHEAYRIPKRTRD